MEKREFSKKAKIFFIGFGVATFIGLISTAIRVTTELAENYYDLKPEDFSKIIYPLVDELSASYSFLILIPFMNYLFKKFQLTKDTWIKVFVQNSTANDRVYVYGLFGWRFNPPFGALYVIYSHDQYDLTEGPFSSDSFFLKITMPASCFSAPRHRAYLPTPREGLR